MPHSTATHTLFPQQSRLINATEGFRLEVTSGSLWLTRPGDAVDRFLVAGSSIELHENHVLIQSDSPGKMHDVLSACYLLTPLHVPETQALDVPKSAPGYGFNFGGKLASLWNLRTALVNF
jgi:hypothetical protein